MKERPMTTWTSDELAKIRASEELEIAPLRPDGTLRDPVTIWVVRHGDDLYVRSVNGPTAAWFRGAQIRHAGRIRAGAVEKDVSLVDADHAIDEEIDKAYRSKYHRYSENTLRRITSADARSTTGKLIPRSTEASGETVQKET
jgi:hypothetical protein